MAIYNRDRNVKKKIKNLLYGTRISFLFFLYSKNRTHLYRLQNCYDLGRMGTNLVPPSPFPLCFYHPGGNKFELVQEVSVVGISGRTALGKKGYDPVIRIRTSFTLKYFFTRTQILYNTLMYSLRHPLGSSLSPSS